MFSPKLLLISAVAVALVGSTFAVSSLYVSAQDNGERIVNGGIIAGIGEADSCRRLSRR